MHDPWALLAGLWSFLHVSLALLCLVYLMLQRKEPAAAAAWIFAILFLPVLGAVVYLAFGSDRMARRARRRRERTRLAQSLVPAVVGNLASPIDAKGQLQIYKLLERICPYPPVAGNRLTILTDMYANFQQQIDAIYSAVDHVHLEYYIFRPDSIGERFGRALADAARRGVEVRFLYDAVGGLSLTNKFLRGLTDAGVVVARHIPMSLFSRRWIFNFRNHRKILVVDGKVAFMGGANIGEEYLGRSDVGAWFDMHLKIEGPAVLHLQRVFAGDWAFASGNAVKGSRYFPKTPPAGDLVAQVVPGGPHMETAVFHELFFSAISTAVARVRLMTPYFVPTEPLRVAVETAARRGVDVQIMVPGTSTKPFVRLASHSYYAELLDAGVKIHEFTPGFLHAKMLTIDGRWSLVGTPNFDNRSVRLNFEVGLVTYDVETTLKLDRIFDENLRVCARVDPKHWRERGLAVQVVENFARLFSPTL
jgi:cardiolipin synthase